MLQVRRTFAPDARLFVQYSVLGAAKEDSTRMPHVWGGYEIRRADGTVLKAAAPTLIRPTSLGALIRLHGIALEKAAPGAYEGAVTVRDGISGRTLESREPFEVAAAAVTPTASNP